MLNQTDPVGVSTAPLLASFLCEGAAQHLVGMGHNLANIAARLCLENTVWNQRLTGAPSVGQ